MLKGRPPPLTAGLVGEQGGVPETSLPPVQRGNRFLYLRLPLTDGLHITKLFYPCQREEKGGEGRRFWRKLLLGLFVGNGEGWNGQPTETEIRQRCLIIWSFPIVTKQKSMLFLNFLPTNERKESHESTLHV